MRALRVAAAGTFVALLLAVLTGAAAEADVAASLPSGAHCGLFQSGVEWVDAAHIKGYFYAYGVIRLSCPCGSTGATAKCKSIPISQNAYAIAVLALHGQKHPYGFTCAVSPPINSGYCTKGTNVKTVQAVSWAPETDCAIPDPPYTPAALPAMCKS